MSQPLTTSSRIAAVFLCLIGMYACASRKSCGEVHARSVSGPSKYEVLNLLAAASSRPRGPQIEVPAGFPALIVPEGLGINVHFRGAPLRDLALIREAGFRFVRADMRWHEVERERDKYDFERSQHDAQVAAFLANGLRPLYALDYNNPVYTDKEGPRAGVTVGIVDDVQRGAYARFVGAAAARYRGKGLLWEIWNEPNHPKFWRPGPDAAAYVQLTAAASAQIRSADPEARIVGPATSRVPMAWLEECMKLGLLQHIDGVTVHPYRDEEPETVQHDYSALRDLIRGFAPGRDIPVLSGEWGYSLVRANGQPLSPARQASYLVRSYFTNLAAGVPLTIWYDWKRGRNERSGEENFGVLTHDDRYTPAFEVVRTLTGLLDGYRFEARIPLAHDDAFALLLSHTDRHALVLWTRGERYDLRLEYPGMSPKFVSLYGDALQLLEQRLEGATISLTEEPVYVLF